MEQPKPGNNAEGIGEKKKFSDFFYNPVTYVGAFLALLVFTIEALLFGIDFFTKGHNVYLGIITYTLLPPFLILGLILIPVGALRKRRRVLKGLVEWKAKPISIDLSVASHRNALAVFIIGTVILFVMTAIGSYKAFHYTESVHFCGITCHKVMRPQYVTYLQSPHARVKCVECHIGSGASWYVRSKLSGARQVYHTLKGDYSKPIPTPIKNLRPAKETCGQCHWPNKFYHSFETEKNYYLMDDSEYPQWYLRMLVKVGGGNGHDLGIHAHMNVDNDIYYYAEDEKRQKITWVKSIDKEGKVTVYKSPDYSPDTETPPADKIRQMDCMDCHNRPTHQMKSPMRLTDAALQKRLIDPGIPKIKMMAVKVLSEKYETTPEARDAIRTKIEKYYQKKYTEYYTANRAKIEAAISQLIDIYEHNFFPEMKVRWDIYAENIGHLISLGCFRCHDGQHTSPKGKTISHDCNACHTIIEQGPPGALEKSTEGLPFKHPVDIEGMWKEMPCSDCHTGGE